MLICGETGFKNFLSQKIAPDAHIIHINQETNISQLIGYVSLTDKVQEKEYILELIIKMCHEGNFESLRKDLQNYFFYHKNKKLIKELKKSKKEKENDFDEKKVNKDNSSSNEEKEEMSKINLNELKEKSSKIEQKIKNIIQKKLDKNDLRDSLKDILIHLEEKLLNINDEENNEGIFNDFTTVFKTGILTENIIKQKNIILKNLSNLSASQFERCNDLYNYNPKLTLNEDFCNTLTNEKNRELIEFSNGFRIIGVIPLGTLGNFSEPAISRFTLIYTSSYQNNEKISIIEALINSCYKKEAENYINEYIKILDCFINDYEKNFKKLSFKLIVKIIKFSKYLNDINKEEKEKNLILSIFKCLCSNMNNNTQKNQFREIILNLKYTKKIEYEFLKEDKIEDFSFPFYFENNNFISKKTNLKIQCSQQMNKELEEDKYSFVYTFKEMLDYIHLAISTKYPLIIKGNTGIGKKTAINYICKRIGYEIIHIYLSNSTSLDDLFCKVNLEQENNQKIKIIRSKLLDAIERKNIGTNYIILIENLEQASPNILEALIPIFDNSQDYILLPTGEQIFKSNFNLIATFDFSSKNSNYDLPEEIINNSLICNISKIMRDKKDLDLKKIEFIEISKKIFNDKINKNESDKFIDDFILITNFTINNQLKEIFSLNDFTKFIKFREQTKNIFDYDIILTMLLIHKFQFKKDINKLISELHYSIEDFWPIFGYENQEISDNENKKYFYISPYGSKKKLQKEIKSEINLYSLIQIKKQINSLTFIQRLGLIFLLLSVNSNIPVIIQGETGSGKSHLIRLFAKLCGENLEVIELNNDSGIQILSGQIIPNSELTNDEITSLQSVFRKINDIKDINNILNDIEIEKPENWKPSKFINILEKIQKLPEKIKKINKKILSKLKKN